MNVTPARAAQLIAILLISLVVTQVIYVALYVSEAAINRPVIWTVETVASLLIAPLAAVLLVHTRRFTAAWGAVLAAAILNVIQLAMGVAMFGPLFGGGEALAPVAQAVLAASFFILYAGKFLFGFAALDVGLAAARTASGLTKIIGGLAAFSGIAALILTPIAMAAGREFIEGLPGASGTLSMLFLALLLGWAVRDDTAA